MAIPLNRPKLDAKRQKQRKKATARRSDGAGPTTDPNNVKIQIYLSVEERAAIKAAAALAGTSMNQFIVAAATAAADKIK